MPVQQFEGIRGQRSDCSLENPSSRYHFDASSKKCVQVEFSGCFGTDNLFNTVKECQDFCSDINFDTETEEIASTSEGICLNYFENII